MNVGTHEGALLYTLGERVALSGASGGPWYVVSKDISRNTLIVSQEKNSSSECKKIQVTNSNFFKIPKEFETITVQFRYHGPLVEGTFRKNIFTPNAPLPEVLAPGQSLVLYKNDEVLGGGTIESCQ